MVNVSAIGRAWRERGVLDDLLPETTAGALDAMMKRPPDERPSEGLFFEFKAVWTPKHIAKVVGAFANTQGGFLFLGADALNGQLHSLPGLDCGTDWAAEVARNIIGHISPLPAWEVIRVLVPGSTNREVVIVKVPRSHRTPHIATVSGRIYQRSPGGTSDPITDRATLDLVVRRGLDDHQAVVDRAERFVDRLPALHSLDYDRVRKFQFAAVAVPLPLGAFQQAKLLTARGAKDATSFFARPNRDLGDGIRKGILQDGVVLTFGDKQVNVFKDGTVELMWQSGEYPKIPVVALDGLLEDMLTAQARLTHPIRESRVFIRFGGNDVDLATGWGAAGGWRESVPWEFKWHAETATGVDGSRPFREEFMRRLWRSVGVDAYDPE